MKEKVLNYFSIIETNDFGFLLSGTIDISASGGQGATNRVVNRHAGGDYWAIKLDANGTKEWRRFYGGSNTDTPYDIATTDDGGYILLGTSDSFDVDIQNNRGAYDYWAVKIDASGTKVWERSYGGDEIDQAYAITKTNDGNFIIVGDSRSNSDDVSSNYGSADTWAIKINQTGEKIWEKNYGGSSFESAKSCRIFQFYKMEIQLECTSTNQWLGSVRIQKYSLLGSRS